MAGGYFVGIFDGAPQFEPDCHLALPADWKLVACKQRSLMHQAMGIMRHAVDTAFWDGFSGPVFLFQPGFLDLRCLPKGNTSS